MTIAKPIMIWHDELLTGVSQMDEQHHMLVNMLNDAQQRLSIQCLPEQLTDLVHDLMSYALYHFEAEEALMLETRYDPGLQALHIQEHRDFSAKVADIQKALSQGKPISAEELLGFLSDWLHKHILNTDKRLGEFLATLPEPKP